MFTTFRPALALLLAGAAALGVAPTQARAAGSQIEKVANKSLIGAAYSRLRNLSYEQCVRRCLEDDRCIALEHYKGGGIIHRSSNCALFSSVREARDSRASDIGYKRAVSAKSGGSSLPDKSARDRAASPGAGGPRPDFTARPTSPPVSPDVLRRAEEAHRKALEANRSLQAERAQRAERAPAPPPPAPAPEPQRQAPAALPPVASAPPPSPSVAAPPPPPPSAPAPDRSAGLPAPEAPRTRGLTRSPAPVPGTPSQPTDSAAPAASQADWQVVPVFYGTDRNRKDIKKRIAYGNDRARRLELGQALVTVPRAHQVPNIERPWTLSIPYFGVVYEAGEDPKQHFTIQEIKALTKAEMLAKVKARLQGSQDYRNQSLVFVHGYNVGFDDAIYRTAQIAYDLQYDGAAFSYSWPSGNGWTSYPYDRDSAQQAEQYLYEFVQMVLNETGTEKISIIAHSMGNQMLLQVLRSLKSRSPDTVARINQVVLAAPDVDRDSFAFLASEIRGIARGITLYAASNDVALEASRIFAGNQPRAGDVPPDGPVVVPGIDTIDITAVSTSYLALNHNNYAEHSELLADIKSLIQKSVHPPELRNSAYRPVTLPAGIYWRYSN